MSIDRLLLFTRHIFIDNRFEGLHAGIHWRYRVKWDLVLTKIRTHNYKFSGSFMQQHNIVFFIKNDDLSKVYHLIWSIQVRCAITIDYPVVSIDLWKN